MAVNSWGMVIVSKYDQEIPQSQTAKNWWHGKEGPHNNNETPGRQTNQNNQLFLPHRDDCNLDILERIQQNLKAYT